MPYSLPYPRHLAQCLAHGRHAEVLNKQLPPPPGPTCPPSPWAHRGGPGRSPRALCLGPPRSRCQRHDGISQGRVILWTKGRCATSGTRSRTSSTVGMMRAGPVWTSRQDRVPEADMTPVDGHSRAPQASRPDAMVRRQTGPAQEAGVQQPFCARVSFLSRNRDKAAWRRVPERMSQEPV